MPNVEDELIDPLNDISRKLIEYGRYRINLSNILKVTSLLNFDTFIDNHKQYKRVSIAGSIVVIDIDFDEQGNKALNASLSLATDAVISGETSGAESENIDFDVTDERQSELKYHEFDLSTVSDFSSENMTLITGFISKESRSLAKSILLLDLTKSLYLKSFIDNIHYLFNLDKLSIINFDLFKYMNEIAVGLSQLYKSHVEENLKESHTKFNKLDAIEGYSGLGKPLINLDNSIGLYLKYWKDNRFFPVSEYPSTTYCLKFDFISYEKELLHAQKIWTNGSWIDETAEFKSIAGLNCILNIKFCSGPILLPQNLLDSLNIEYSEQDLEKDEGVGLKGKQEKRLDDFYFNYTEMNERVTVKDKIINTNLKLKKNFRFLKVSSINLNTIDSLSKVLPVLRNWLLLHNVLNNIFSYCNKFNNHVPSKVDKINRNSIITIPNFSSANPINSETSTLRLEDFLNDFETSEKISKNLNSNDLLLSVIVEQAESRIILTLENNFLNETLILELSDGVISLQKVDDAMDVDGKPETFIRGLNITEDLFETLKFVYF